MTHLSVEWPSTRFCSFRRIERIRKSFCFLRFQLRFNLSSFRRSGSNDGRTLSTFEAEWTTSYHRFCRRSRTRVVVRSQKTSPYRRAQTRFLQNSFFFDRNSARIFQAFRINESPKFSVRPDWKTFRSTFVETIRFSRFSRVLFFSESFRNEKIRNETISRTRKIRRGDGKSRRFHRSSFHCFSNKNLKTKTIESDIFFELIFLFDFIDDSKS